MSIEQEVDILRNIPLFSNIEPSRLKLLAFTSERLTFKPEQMLFKQGDSGDAAYILIEGSADVIVNTPSGPLRVASVGDSDFVGEIAILCDVPRTASVQATSDLTTLKITKDLFINMLKDFPDISIEVMRVLAGRLETTTAQLTAAERKLAELS